MKKVLLGSTGLKVSVLAFGTLVISPLQADLSVSDAQGLMEYALDRGVNLFDTGHLYNNYQFFTNISSSKKQQMIISSKSYQPTYKGMMEEIDYGLKSIKRDYFDIFMLHEQESTMTLKGHRGALKAIYDAKEQGKVRAVGVSTHSVKLTKDLLLHPEFEVIHPIFNKVGHGLIQGTIEQQKENIKNLYNVGVGLFVMKPLGGGRLYKEFLESLVWIKNYKYKHSVAIGVKNKQELDVDIAIFEDNYSDEMEKTLQLTEKKLFYRRDLCAMCLKCVEFCQFGAISHDKENDCIVINKDKCVTCGYCVANCPELAIRIL